MIRLHSDDNYSIEPIPSPLSPESNESVFTFDRNTALKDLKVDCSSKSFVNHNYVNDEEPEFKIETSIPEECVNGPPRNLFAAKFAENRLQMSGNFNENDVNEEEEHKKKEENGRAINYQTNEFVDVVSAQPTAPPLTDQLQPGQPPPPYNAQPPFQNHPINTVVPIVVNQPKSQAPNIFVVDSGFVGGSPDQCCCVCCWESWTRIFCFPIDCISNSCQCHHTHHHGSCDCNCCDGCDGCDGDCGGCDGCDCGDCSGCDCDCSGCDCSGVDCNGCSNC